MKTILSIDYDYWTQTDPMNDWQHADTHFHATILWSIRAADLLKEKRLASCCISRFDIRPGMLFDHLRNDKAWSFNGRLAIAESHTSIIPWLDATFPTDTLRIINVDAHCDWGYIVPGTTQNRTIDDNTDNWVARLIEADRVRELVQFYPRWKRHVGDVDWRRSFVKTRSSWQKKGIAISVRRSGRFWKRERIDGVFICRSGAWSPPWLDGGFVSLCNTFLAGAHWRSAVLYHFRTLNDLRRPFSWKEVRNAVHAFKQVRLDMGRLYIGAVPATIALNVSPSRKGGR